MKPDFLKGFDEADRGKDVRKGQTQESSNQISLGAIQADDKDNRGQSWRTTLSSELFTFSPPLYSMKPRSRNLFMKKLTRDRVVPTISARVLTDPRNDGLMLSVFAEAGQ